MLDLLLRLYVEVSVNQFTPLMCEDDCLSFYGRGGYKPARIEDWLKDRSGALYAMIEQKGFLCFSLFVQIHDVYFLKLQSWFALHLNTAEAEISVLDSQEN